MKFVVTVLVLGLGIADGAAAFQKIPLSAAVPQCTKQAKIYARTIEGRGAYHPDDYKINQRYRSCVHAKSGQYPPGKVTKRGLRVSGSFSVGVSYGNY